MIFAPPPILVVPVQVPGFAASTPGIGGDKIRDRGAGKPMVPRHEGNQGCYDGFSFSLGRADAHIRPLRGDHTENRRQEKPPDDEDDRYFDERETGLSPLVNGTWQRARNGVLVLVHNKLNGITEP